MPPHLVWPEDRAWCLACEVDEDIEFTVAPVLHVGLAADPDARDSAATVE